MIDRDPFAPPVELRDPARRFRARLAAPVTLWTSGARDGHRGLTVSSLLVAEGDPARILGLVSPNTDLWDALRESRAFVVHVLERGHRDLAERFAGRLPSPGGLFHGLAVEGSDWGPVLSEIGTRALCRVEALDGVGHGRLVTGIVERFIVGEVAEPLLYLRGRYRRIAQG